MLAETVIIIIVGILLINVIGAILTVFSEKRDIATIWAWLLVLLLLPVLGFVIFYFAGSRISNKKFFD